MADLVGFLQQRYKFPRIRDDLLKFRLTEEQINAAFIFSQENMKKNEFFVYNKYYERHGLLSSLR